ncbi:hypothetical protein O3M35_005559 [Rhynocoris fuscipes]
MNPNAYIRNLLSKHIYRSFTLTLTDYLEFILRVFMGIFLLLLLYIVFIFGPISIAIGALAVETICFLEVINIYLNTTKLQSKWFFKSLAAYFYLVINYFLFVSLIIDKSACIDKVCYMLFDYYSPYHINISFITYLIGFICFIINIPIDNTVDYLLFFSCLHTIFIVISIPAHLAIVNLLYGRLWILIPLLLTNINDILAYTFGKLFGKTPLIKISPKKTWEGFIGGAVFTVILAHFIAKFIAKYDLENSFFCPETELNEKCISVQDELVVAALKDQYYMHVIVMSLLASFIAPFGGIFASAFKRACRVKNFSNIVPGHGGLLDRYDCQIVMIVCVNVYIRTFVRDDAAEFAYLSRKHVNFWT